VVIIAGLRFAARSLAWISCAEPSNLKLADAFAATIAGDALGNVTPLGVLASEPAKVYFVNRQMPTVAAVASVAAENAFYTASVLVMIGAGALTFFNVANLAPSLRLGAQIVVAGVVVTGIIGVWVLRRRPAILSTLARSVARWSGRAATAPDRLREIEVHFYALLTWPFARIARVVWWEAVFHVAAVAEVFLVMRLLPTGRPITLVDAFVLETAGRLITVAFKFVPYRLGIDEAGSAVVARALAIDPAVGVALALVRKLRILWWNAVGLLLLATKRP
jgi:hypothetical protein